MDREIMEDVFRRLTYGMVVLPGATEPALRALQAEARTELPDDYIAFLRWSNGAEGEIGPNYIVIWSAEEIEQDPYPWEEVIPGILFITSDGAEAVFGFDTRVHPMPIVISHQDDLDLSGLVLLAPSFSAFLTFLAQHDWTEYWFNARQAARNA
jgi:hypothetical protein